MLGKEKNPHVVKFRVGYNKSANKFDEMLLDYV